MAIPADDPALEAFIQALAARTVAARAIVAESVESDPCARLTVRPVRGGIADAPIERHRVKMVADPTCTHGTCKHFPRCERVPIIVCKPGEACDCGPVDVENYGRTEAGSTESWADSKAGSRARGLPAHKKMAPFERHYDGSAHIEPPVPGARPDQLIGPRLPELPPVANGPTTWRPKRPVMPAPMVATTRMFMNYDATIWCAPCKASGDRQLPVARKRWSPIVMRADKTVACDICGETYMGT